MLCITFPSQWHGWTGRVNVGSLVAGGSRHRKPHSKSKLPSPRSWSVPTAPQREVRQERVRGKGEPSLSDASTGPLTGRPALEDRIPARKPASGRGIYQSSRCRPRGRARGERPDEPGSEPWPWRPDNTGREHGSPGPCRRPGPSPPRGVATPPGSQQQKRQCRTSPRPTKGTT